MHAALASRLDSLSASTSLSEILAATRGIEKESLRITPDGHLAQTPHPAGLGSALTHSCITTDFSEALLEFITPPCPGIDATLAELDRIHRFVYPQLVDDELLWVASMPCLLEVDDLIPVARYGTSNVAQMKTVYRLGLGNRYGRLMQTIAGIHFNFSMADGFWPWWRQVTASGESTQDMKTQAYFGLIRNFHRLAWLLVYLFGASPALCRSFIGGRQHQLEPLTRGTLHAPRGTSLRMGDLGYQSAAQANLDISYNCLEEYVDTLERAVATPHPDYQAIGVRNERGYLQLSTSLLQIENEFYSTIRPKRVTRSGEAPRRALATRGVEYVEIRCLDLDPFLPLGIDRHTAAFVETFLLYCQLSTSPWSDRVGRRNNRENLRRVVNRGREPGLMLIHDGHQRGLQAWASNLLEEMSGIAELQDRCNSDNRYCDALTRQHAKVLDAEETPAARIIALLRERDQPYFHFAMDQARQHREAFLASPLDAGQQARYEAMSAASIEDQRAIEAADTEDFDTYLRRYYAQ